MALLRARRRGRQLQAVVNRTGAVRTSDILVISVLRNERARLPYFLKHYREMGVRHFLFVDNGSSDGSGEYLRDQPDVSLWHTKASYKAAHFGVDWSNHLARRYGVGHWVLTVDVDELLVYPHCDTRPLPAMTDWLDSIEMRSFSAMLLDIYSNRKIEETVCEEGQDPREVAGWFDPGNYTISFNRELRNLWIQGGPRMRAFFKDAPLEAPALNKIPLVKWESGFAYISSTHMLLPRGLNITYDSGGGEAASGVLMHSKFVNTLGEKAAEERARGEHYADGREYAAYLAALSSGPTLWHEASERYINWRQLEVLGLMSKGSWA